MGIVTLKKYVTNLKSTSAQWRTVKQCNRNVLSIILLSETIVIDLDTKYFH
jgi:hypothetical protein